MPVDKYSMRAFVEILNLILLSDDFTELSNKLHERDRNDDYGSLSGYFSWSWADHTFTLRQRIKFDCDDCFPEKILEVRHIYMVNQDQKRSRSIIN